MNTYLQKTRSRLRLLFACVFVSALPCSLSAELVSTTAKLETAPNFDDEAGGYANADDPAIWIHPTNAANSVVVATLKEGGLAVFKLNGARIQHIAAPAAPSPDDEPGRFNNVDLIYGLNIGGRVRDLAVVSDRGRDQIRFYEIDKAKAALGQAPLVDVTAPNVPFVFSANQDAVNEQTTVYGLASTKRNGVGYVFTSQRARTSVATLKIVAAANGKLTYTRTNVLTLPNTFNLPNGDTWTPGQEDDGDQAQVEGMVVDEKLGYLYMGQEMVGIWRIKLWGNYAPRLVEKVREFGVPYTRTFDPEEEEYVVELLWDQDPGFGGDNISADVEGLTIYYGDDEDEDGYLIASSQGDNTFAVFEREEEENGDNDYVGSFKIVTGVVDGVEACDGAMVTNVSLGSAFPQGLFVCQDGENLPVALDADGEERENTNFKFTPWERIARAFSTDLIIDTDAYNPRR
jgi:3-phytase